VGSNPIAHPMRSPRLRGGFAQLVPNFMSKSSSPHLYQMYMFCGDSHLRQFSAYDGMDLFSLSSFPGATMKGLSATARGAIGHRKTILALAAAPTPKTLFLMFGNVDLDVTWFRKSILEEEIDEEDFFRQRRDALTAFVSECQELPEGLVRRVCVILPQLPTVGDPHFIQLTAVVARLEERQLTELAVAQDCSHLARCRRTARFNDFISQNLPADDDLAVYRIDDQMADETGLILPRFVRKGAPDIHARSEATLPLWWEELRVAMPDHSLTEELHRHARGQPPGVLPDLDE
jgi:hypothetical protein